MNLKRIYRHPPRKGCPLTPLKLISRRYSLKKCPRLDKAAKLLTILWMSTLR